MQRRLGTQHGALHGCRLLPACCGRRDWPLSSRSRTCRGNGVNVEQVSGQKHLKIAQSCRVCADDQRNRLTKLRSLPFRGAACHAHQTIQANDLQPLRMYGIHDSLPSDESWRRAFRHGAPSRILGHMHRDFPTLPHALSLLRLLWIDRKRPLSFKSQDRRLAANCSTLTCTF